jgi:nitroreductase
MQQQEVFESIVQFRRSNRKFDPNIAVPNDVIERSLKRAILSPNSSNMQLWEFHWINSPAALEQMVPICLNQSAAKTAQQMVVFVARPDKWKARQQWHLNQVKNEISGEPTKAQKMMLQYYGKVMPLLYAADPLRPIQAFLQNRRCICCSSCDPKVVCTCCPDIYAFHCSRRFSYLPARRF